MALDMNPIASGYGNPPPTAPTGGPLGTPAPGQKPPDAGALPPWLQQQDNPSVAGVTNNLVRALMGGYQQGEARRAAAGGAAGGTPGAPMDVSPQLPGMNPQPAVPFAGAGPWGVGPTQSDTAMMAAMSPPPNPFGGGSGGAVY